jgi:peptidyl-prolyl cis-trans isomerase A (cyclophilin A)
MRKVLGAIALALLPLPSMAQVYADFQTSLGNFTCQLNYVETPKAVANFMTLADGSRVWMDESTGQISTLRPAQPFYDGLTFHRVYDETGFRIIQGGSRKGDDTDGPGYNLPDEFKESVPASYKFDQSYTLGMINIGGLNTIGSQFFITGCPLTELEGRYTAIGKVVSGTETVEAILGVDTDSIGKPVTPVVIQHVTVRRVGKDAMKFVPSRIALPKVTSPKTHPNTAVGQWSMVTFPQAAKTTARFFYRDFALNTPWTSAGFRYIGPGEKTITSAVLAIPNPAVNITATLQYRVGVATYPADMVTPGTLAGNQLYLENESGEYLFRFNATGDQTYMIVLPSGETKTGTIAQAYYSADGYSCDLIVDLGNDGYYRFHLSPTTKSKAGTITGPQSGEFLYFGLQWVSIADGTDFSWSPLPKTK